MSTAVINELFEEGITRSRELSDAADEAMRAIDDMAKEAEELAQRVDTETAEARQHIKELTTRLERSEGALEAASNQAEGALTGLAGKSAELATEAAALLDRVKKSLVELDTRREEHGKFEAASAADMKRATEHLVNPANWNLTESQRAQLAPEWQERFDRRDELEGLAMAGVPGAREDLHAHKREMEIEAAR